MGKAGFYAVKRGKGGPAVYTSWDATSEAVHGFPGARHKKFATRQEAEAWLDKPESEYVSEPRTATMNSPAASGVPSQHSFQDPSPSYERHSSPYRRRLAPSSVIDLTQSPYKSPGRSKASAIEVPDSPVSPIRPNPKRPFQASPYEDDASTKRRQLNGSYNVFMASSPIPNPSQLVRSSSTLRSSSSPRELVTTTGPSSNMRTVKEEVKQDHVLLEPSPTPPIELSSEQQRILRTVQKGKSLFFTGSAGTGKSVLLRAIIAELRRTHEALTDAVAVTAPTGIAAVNIGGVTLHSFAVPASFNTLGIGLGKEPVGVLINKIRRFPKTRHRWMNTKVLIIDEISMVDGALFDKLDAIARRLRGDFDQRWASRPFGGIQLIVSGDFFQLPPVPERQGRAKIAVKYAFEAESWMKCIPVCYQLTHVFRQKDPAFAEMLNLMRVGELTPKMIAQFQRLSRKLVYDDGLEPTQLFPLKQQVDRANMERLNSLPGRTYKFHAKDSPGVDGAGKPITRDEADKLLERLVALKELSLRKGAQVMLITNLLQGHLINGSLGRVIDFISPEEAHARHMEIAEAENANPGQRQRPRYFDATHTLKRLAGTKPCGCLAEKACECSDSDSEGSVELLNGDQRWPIVEFTNGRTLVLRPVEFTVENILGTTEAKREQIPLILAWALSIHKSQGQTIERVKIDLGGTFEKGQAYVALSRATSLQTLQVLSFDPSKVMADRKVIEWSKKLRVHTEDEPDSPEAEEEEEEEEREGEQEEKHPEREEVNEEEDVTQIPLKNFGAQASLVSVASDKQFHELSDDENDDEYYYDAQESMARRFSTGTDAMDIDITLRPFVYKPTRPRLLSTSSDMTQLDSPSLELHPPTPQENGFQHLGQTFAQVPEIHGENHENTLRPASDILNVTPDVAAPEAAPPRGRTPTATTAPLPDPAADASRAAVWPLKLISWPPGTDGQSLIVMQSRNGNVLILRNDINIFPKNRKSVSYEYLASLIADFLVSRMPDDTAIDGLSAALSKLPDLQEGMHINSVWTSHSSFKQLGEGGELKLFELCGVDLVHGWLADPNSLEYNSLIKAEDYDGAVNLIVAADDLTKGGLVESSLPEMSPNKDEPVDLTEEQLHVVRDALLIRHFLETNSSQLTYTGLFHLSTSLDPGLYAFFRNSHLSVLFKTDAPERPLYTLVTDSAFAREDAVVWETLEDVDGSASMFVDANLIKASTAGGDYSGRSAEAALRDVESAANNADCDNDMLLAQQLQAEEERLAYERHRAREVAKQQQRTQSKASSTSAEQRMSIVSTPSGLNRNNGELKRTEPSKKTKGDCIIM
ncbi:hypothetical protein FRB99_003177 [Tulasnella sp. 403]|nr:hypothetical protein FRB99_003177 [Tulasnella sp. 403]